MQKFNINSYVRVKLTPLGKEILSQGYDSVTACMSISPARRSKYKAYKAEVLAEIEANDGWYKAQMWNIMKMFGPHMGLGLQNPFETEIEINVE